MPDDTVADPVPVVPPETPEGTGRGGRLQRVVGGRAGLGVGVTVGVVGVVLVVLGVLGFARASDRQSSTSQADTLRRSSQVAERRAADARAAIDRAVTALDDNVRNLTKASSELSAAQNAITDAFNHAVDLANGGDIGGAQAAYSAQSPALAALDAKLAASQQALAQAQQRLAQLRAAPQA